MIGADHLMQEDCVRQRPYCQTILESENRCGRPVAPPLHWNLHHRLAVSWGRSMFYGAGPSERLHAPIEGRISHLRKSGSTHQTCPNKLKPILWEQLIIDESLHDYSQCWKRGCLMLRFQGILTELGIANNILPAEMCMANHLSSDTARRNHWCRLQGLHIYDMRQESQKHFHTAVMCIQLSSSSLFFCTTSLSKHVQATHANT